MKSIKCPKCGEVFTIDESSYQNIINQIRTTEFENDVKSRVEDAIQKNTLSLEKKYSDELKNKDIEILNLQAKINDATNEKNSALSQQKLESEKKFITELNDKDRQISELKNNENKIRIEEDLKKEKEINSLKENYNEVLKKKEVELKDLQEELTRVKEHKLSLSTKAVGEDLEQYCKNEFEKLRAVAYRDAFFEKDNEVKEGTKGDFIFRDYDDSIEYISIMFEMKNESDATESKHKNEDFFKKLDNDRKKKNCEYAVLVSMLEQDNDFYNKGIAEICQYEKMYVVRPQNFMDIISLLRNMAKNSLKDKRALIEKQKADIDLTNFTSNVHTIIEQSGTHYKNAVNQHEKAILEINNAIKKLEDARDALMLSNRHMDKFTNKIDELSDVKKLTSNAPSVLELINK